MRSSAHALREHFRDRLAWVERDHPRRILLREGDVPGGQNIGLMARNVKRTLRSSYHGEGSLSAPS